MNSWHLIALMCYWYSLVVLMLNEVYISKKLYHKLTPCVDSRKIVTVNVVGKNICLLFSDCVPVCNHFSKNQPILVSNHASQLSD